MIQNKKLVFMFSGQGSQHVGMAKELFKSDTSYQEILYRLDEIVIQIMGYSVIRELYENKNAKRLEEDVSFSSIALAEVQYALALYVQNIIGKPDAVIGTSLGEYVSYVVSGVLSFEELVSYLGPTLGKIQNLSPHGGMITVLGNVKTDYIDNEEINQTGVIGAVNYDGHFMLSGTSNEIKLLDSYYKERNQLSVVLPVKVAFHSDMMLSKYRNIAEYHMKAIKPSLPDVECVSCLTGNKQDKITRKILYDVLTKPILFQKAIRNFDRQESVFLDLGPMGTLKNFVLKNRRQEDWEAHSCMLMSGKQLIQSLNI